MQRATYIVTPIINTVCIGQGVSSVCLSIYYIGIQKTQTESVWPIEIKLLLTKSRQVPGRPFRNFRDSTSGYRRILRSSTWHRATDFEASKLYQGQSGSWTNRQPNRMFQNFRGLKIRQSTFLTLSKYVVPLTNMLFNCKMFGRGPILPGSISTTRVSFVVMVTDDHGIMPFWENEGHTEK